MKITFSDKTSIDNRPDLSNMEKVTGGNVNEIKNVVNANADELDATKVKVENINTSLENFNKEVEALKEYDTKQDEKNEYLEKEAVRLREDIEAGQLVGEAEGENIDLDDSSGARFRKFGISGNHSQETREGIQLLKIKDVADTTVDGITYSIKNGKITLNGTSTAKVDILLYATVEGLDKSQSYAFNAIASNLNNLYFNTYRGGRWADIIQQHSGSNKSGWVSTGYDSYYFDMNISAGATFNNFVVTPMFCKGTTIPSYYEQYGAMPSLEFPSGIKAVGSNINLFDGNFIKAYFGGTSYKQYVEDSTCRSIIIPCEANTTYTITKKTLSNRFMVLDTSKIPENKQDVDRNIVQNNNALSLTVTTSSTAKYLIAYVSSTEEEPEVKIEKGSTATSYSQYGQGCASITVCNKNLFEETSNNKKIKTAYGYLISGNYMLQKGKKYAVSFDTNNNSGKVYLNENVLKFVGSTYDAACDGKRHTIIATAIVDGYQNNRNLIKTGVATTDYYDVLNISVCEYVDDSSSDFVTHQEQAITMPIQQGMLQGDYIDWKNEKEVHNWCKETCNGTEKWAQQQTTSAGYWYIHDIGGKGTSGNVAENILCNKLKGITGIDAWKGNGEGICVQDNIAIYLKDYSQDVTLDDFKKMLSENPLEIYYKVKTQIELPFTDEQKAVAKQIKEILHTYKNITHIYSTDETSPNLNVEYAKDLNTVVNNIQALVLNNASEEVSG